MSGFSLPDSLAIAGLLLMIYTDVPMPDRPFGVVGNGGRNRKEKWPFADLEVGHSFVMPSVSQGLASAHCNRYSKKFDRKFRTAKVENGIRVWRVE